MQDFSIHTEEFQGKHKPFWKLVKRFKNGDEYWFCGALGWLPPSIANGRKHRKFFNKNEAALVKERY